MLWLTYQRPYAVICPMAGEPEGNGGGPLNLGPETVKVFKEVFGNRTGRVLAAVAILAGVIWVLAKALGAVHEAMNKPNLPQPEVAVESKLAESLPALIPPPSESPQEPAPHTVEPTHAVANAQKPAHKRHHVDKPKQLDQQATAPIGNPSSSVLSPGVVGLDALGSNAVSIQNPSNDPNSVGADVQLHLQPGQSGTACRAINDGSNGPGAALSVQTNGQGTGLRCSVTVGP